jgi:Amino acid kinase family
VALAQSATDAQATACKSHSGTTSGAHGGCPDSLVPSQESAPSDLDRVRILSEALPYLQQFRGRTIVVKYGGAAMKDPTLKAGVINDLVLLACVGVKPVLVHGGGPEINIWLNKVGIESKFKNGLRVTGAPRAAACAVPRRLQLLCLARVRLRSCACALQLPRSQEPAALLA